jgi:hypothetical protein
MRRSKPSTKLNGWVAPSRSTKPSLVKKAAVVADLEAVVVVHLAAAVAIATK